MGYAFIDSRVTGGRLVEFDTEPCGHCQAVISTGRKASGPFTVVASEARSDIAPAGGYCATCQRTLCRRCARDGHEAGDVCTFFMRRVDAAYERMVAAEMAGRQGR